MGVNAAGLAVLWTYIDDGERNFAGLPTNVLIRELLAQRSLDAAVALLRRVEHAVPNNFLLADEHRVVDAEVSPQRCLFLARSDEW